MNIPKIAILLATYNGEKWITDQINSIFAQVNVKIDLFVCDDQSTDNTLNIIKLSKHTNYIKYIKHNNRRFNSGAQNFFYMINNINLLNYDYFGFSDQDDLWKENKLLEAIKLLKKKNCDYYSSSFKAFWQDGNKLYINKISKQKEFDYIFQSPGPGSTFLMTYNGFKNLKSFIEKNFNNLKKIISHDWFIYAFARSNNYNWVIDENPYLDYRQHNTNEIGVNKGFKSYLRRFNAILNGNYAYQILEIAKCLSLKNKIILYLRKPNLKNKFLLITNAFQCRRSFKECFIIIIFFIFYNKNLAEKKLKTLFINE